MLRKRRTWIAVTIALGLLVGFAVGGAAFSPPDERNNPSLRSINAEARECFQAQGFAIADRLDFNVDEDARALVFVPLVADSDGTFSVVSALMPLSGVASRVEREAAIETCLAQLKADLGLPDEPVGVARRALAVDRVAVLEGCLGQNRLLERFTEIEYYETADGHAAIEGTHPDMSVDEAQEFLAGVRNCLSLDQQGSS